jgi:Ca2+/H+ antiporter, TMEM165/GDT1 family
MLSAFTAGLLLITISELGDKTFFISAILATRHPRRWVFAGAIAALATMTLISVLAGQAAGLLPRHYVKAAEVALFLGFGLKLVYDALQMSGQETMEEECKEAAETLKEAGPPLPVAVAPWPIASKAFTLTFLAEWGDRTQLATITLAAGNNPLGVAVGATLGHAICAAIAVIFGRMIAGRLSEKTLTLMGGALFLVFGAVAAMSLA